MRSSSTRSCRSDERSLADRFRGEGFLGPQSFESFQRVRGVAWFERGDHPVFPLTRNPTSLGCWRLRFKSGRTHFPPGGGCHSGRREETNAPDSSLVPGPDRRNTTLMRRSAIATAVGWNHGTRQTQQGGSRTEPERPGTPRSWIEPESSEHDVLGDRL